MVLVDATDVVVEVSGADGTVVAALIVSESPERRSRATTTNTVAIANRAAVDLRMSTGYRRRRCHSPSRVIAIDCATVAEMMSASSTLSFGA